MCNILSWGASLMALMTSLSVISCLFGFVIVKSAFGRRITEPFLIWCVVKPPYPLPSKGLSLNGASGGILSWR